MLLPVYLLWCYFVLCVSNDEKYFVISANNKEGNNVPAIGTNDAEYKPTWESLDKRPLPSWYDDVKLGIFLHWGVYSVPSFGSEWFWSNWKEETGNKYHNFMKARYPPNFTYQDFARDFTTEFFNPLQWADIFQASGAKYVVLTSKHHEGYALWPSKYSFSWNSMDVGPQKDLIGELAEAIRSTTNLKFGLYHSLYEWYNPLYLSDKQNNFTTNNFVIQKVIPELLELVQNYKPEVIWSDGDWEASDTYWKSKEFIAWLYNFSPVKDTVIVNDRWGRNIPCHHGDIYTCTDRYNPGVLQPHKWENCMTIDKKSWGFRRDAVLAEYFTLKELVQELVTTVSCGGNLLMNVGPTKDGIISPIFEDRLRGLGVWLNVNGEAIYNTKPWAVQNDTLNGNVWYTQSKDEKLLYIHILEWPQDSKLRLSSLRVTLTSSEIFLLGCQQKLNWDQQPEVLVIHLPSEARQGQPAWVARIRQQV